MYISEIQIKNYRNYLEEKIIFKPGINIIIGANNAGKTNLIKALELVFGNKRKAALTIDDFCKFNNDFSEPPEISVSVTIKEHQDLPDDKTVVYDWIIQMDPEYTALLTFKYFLPQKHHDEYKELIGKYGISEGGYNQEKCLRIFEKHFLSKYIYRIYGADVNKQEKADTENLDRFDFHYLSALRDVEKQMFYGNNTILKSVLNYFLDYDITNGKNYEELENKEKKKLEERNENFTMQSSNTLQNLIERIERSKILEYAKSTGADKGGVPNFDAKITESELLFALRLIVEKGIIKVPLKTNGLGYNNLLYMALLLSKMQLESSSSMGDNAKIFPILAIEEPEAHLHPSMQSKFLAFLESTIKENNQARQIFINTHSTHITSTVDMESLICLTECDDGKLNIAYPHKAFAKDDKSKNYVQRFLDATKSNMLFADRIVLVEGISEQILLPCFAYLLGKEEELISKHITIINIGGKTFNHFLKMFVNNEEHQFGLDKKVVCITDADPSKKINSKWHGVYPYELDETKDSKELSSSVANLQIEFNEKFDNIFVCYPEAGKGKTLEYEIFRSNSKSILNFLDESLFNTGVYSYKNIRSLIDLYEKELDEMLSFCDLFKINEKLQSLQNCNWKENEKKDALIATILFETLRSNKGELAFNLAYNLRNNENAKDLFIVPNYIKMAIEKVLHE